MRERKRESSTEPGNDMENAELACSSRCCSIYKVEQQITAMRLKLFNFRTAGAN